jgi:hypothetical protein
MGIFSALSGTKNGTPASVTTAANMSRAARTARRGGSAIKVTGGKTAPAQSGKAKS